MEKKTKSLHLRFTPTQFDNIKRRSKQFGTMTNFINQAVAEFSDVTAKDKLDMRRQLAETYAAIDAKLAHAGANLNQAMCRINERAVAGLDYCGLLNTQLRSEVQNCIELCVDIRNMIKDNTIINLRQ